MRVDDDALASAPGVPDDAGPAGQDAASSPPGQPGRMAVLRRRLTPERVLTAVLALLVLAVHDVPYILGHSFWTDETWVAATTKFSLAQLPMTTSSTPIGWTALLRLVSVGGTQVSRLLPLAFAGGAVAAAACLARGLGWRHRGLAIAATVLGGLAVLLVPGMLVRDDLKQYTADACLALLALAATARLERDWSRSRLAVLAAIAAGGMLFSDAVAFLGVAAFAAICAVQLARRAWHRLAQAAVAGAVTAVLMAAVYEATVARAVLPGLTFSPHFRHFYLPLGQGLHGAVKFVTLRFDVVQPVIGLGPKWLAAPLFLAGVITIWRLGRPGTAVTLALLWPEMLALSAAHKYPFLDERTSTFLYAVTAATAAIGVTGICALLLPRLKGAVAAVAAAAAVAGFAVAVHPFVRAHPIPDEDIRAQTTYVAAHAARSDVIVVNMSGNWGFAYYWPAGHPATRPDDAVLQRYEAYFPDQPRIVVARNRDPGGVTAAVSRAVSRARQQAGANGCTRIWLIRIHVSAAEQAAWAAALRNHGLVAAPAGTSGLSLVRPGAGCPAGAG